MMNHRLLASFAFLAICLSASAADHLVGTWKLNPEKSSGGNLAVSHFERDGDSFRNSNGTMSYRFKFDGQDNPVTGSALYDMASWKQIGARGFEHAMKKNGKVLFTVRTVCAADGKTRTWKNTRMLENGGTATTEGIQERTAGGVDPSNPLLGKWRQIPIMKILGKGKGKGIQVMSGIIYTANFDGKDYPASGSNNVDNVSLKRVNAYTVEQTSKKGGKVTVTSNWLVSDDGKMLTMTSKGTRANGEPFNSTGVWERTKR